MKDGVTERRASEGAGRGRNVSKTKKAKTNIGLVGQCARLKIKAD